MIGIYKITNKKDNKSYIGQSKNITRRWHEHIKSLNKGKHHSFKLQDAWNKNEPSDFTFEILKICDVKDLNFYEEKYIVEFNSLKGGYNVKDEIGSNLKQPKDTCKKVSLDLDLLMSRLDNNYHMCLRYIKLYLYSTTMNGTLRRDIEEIKSICDFEKILNIGNAECRKTLSFFKSHNVMQSNKENGIYKLSFDNELIEPFYVLKVKHENRLILYKDMFIDIYDSVENTFHNTLFVTMVLSNLIDKNINGIKLNALRKVLTENKMCNKANTSKFIKRIMQLNDFADIDLIKKHDNFLYINPKFYCCYDYILNKNNICESLFKGDDFNDNND